MLLTVYWIIRFEESGLSGGHRNMSETSDDENLTPWDSLPEERQLELREEYGRYLDSLPPTCSLETKLERFRRWLKQYGISYRPLCRSCLRPASRRVSITAILRSARGAAINIPLTARA
ncbi:MAG: hypothetical protein PVG38_03625 [Gammaproteobacteria bacterium]